MALSLMDGNEAVSWGAMASGCSYFAGYPITPASSFLTYMLNFLPPQGGTCIQCEDEISSIGSCLGASMTGAKVMTATSGPGISLYSENISFAIAGEIPIVIVDVQRLGPSTGSATRGADSDIQFLRWGNTGGLPVIVLAPVDVKDCVTLTMHAFNLAEQYRCPVFIASNKEIAMTKESVDFDAIEKPELIEREKVPAGKSFLPFEVAEGKLTPYFQAIGGNVLTRQNSSTHDPEGYITTNFDLITKSQERLKAKLESSVDQFSFSETYLEPDADTLIIAYGVTARSAKEVYLEKKKMGEPVSLLILKTLWPVPENLIQKVAKDAGRIIVPEMNLGQYVKEIERILPGKKINFIGQMNSKQISPAQIKEVINNG